MTRSHEIVDWSVAARIGRSIAGAGPIVDAAATAAAIAEFHRHVETADHLIREHTGMVPAAAAGPSLVLGRGAWIDANIDGLRSLMAPVSERIAERFSALGRSGIRRVGGAVVGAQVGALLGYVSQKVLGQYDLMLATGDPGRVYFVGPNIIAAERRHGLDESDFRLWIALHEVTHRTQFLAVPWLKEQVQTLIGRYLAGVSLDPERVRRLLRSLAEAAAKGPGGLRRGGFMSLMLSEDQRGVVSQMQSLMTVVEGHGNFVMDSVAEKQIATFRSLREALDSRKESVGVAERAFQKLIAMDMKYEQYAVGQAFFNDVFALGGMDAVNLVWRSAEHLPSADELIDAAGWLRRVQPQGELFGGAGPKAPTHSS